MEVKRLFAGKRKTRITLPHGKDLMERIEYGEPGYCSPGKVNKQADGSFRARGSYFDENRRERPIDLVRKTEREAQRALDERKEEMRTSYGRSASGGRMTLHELADAWLLEQQTSVSKKTGRARSSTTLACLKDAVENV